MENFDLCTQIYCYLLGSQVLQTQRSGSQVLTPLVRGIFFLFRIHSVLTQKLRRRVTFVSFRGDVKSLVLGTWALAFSGHTLANIVVAKPPPSQG